MRTPFCLLSPATGVFRYSLVSMRKAQPNFLGLHSFTELDLLPSQPNSLLKASGPVCWTVCVDAGPVGTRPSVSNADAT